MVVQSARLVVVDASIVAMWVLREEYSHLALSLAADWASNGVQPVAPCFMLAEVASALFKRVRRSELDIAQAQEAMDVVLGFGVRLDVQQDLHRRALGLAHQWGRPTPYDAIYLALAESRNCELWTGDERLYNAVRSELPWVRWIGAYDPTVPPS